MQLRRRVEPPLSVPATDVPCEPRRMFTKPLRKQKYTAGTQ